MKNDDVETDPETRFELFGVFDQASYEADLVAFPDHFDANGWPLFGDYNPYALCHPISGLSWQENPRVPSEDETDAEYEQWFNLAEKFNSLQCQLIGLIRDTPKDPRDDPNDVDSLYSEKSQFAFAGNLAFLREHVLSELAAAFQRRKADVRFAELWGEFRDLARSMGVVASTTKSRAEGRNAPQPAAMKAQRKWFLHWRRYQTEQGKSSRKAIGEFRELVFDIAEGRLQPPDGFEKEWFARALKTDSETKKPARELADFIKRARKAKDCDELLDQAPHEPPEIPPLSIADYNPNRAR